MRAAVVSLLAASAALVGAAAADEPCVHNNQGCPSRGPHGEGEARGVRAASPFGNNAIITHPSGLIKMGVHAEGNLNVDGGVPSAGNGVTFVGLRFVDGGAEYEYTAPGCLCEGVGVYALDTAGNELARGRADVDFGFFGVTDPSIVATASTATGTANYGCVQATHVFTPSATSGYLYEVDVTLTNNCAVPIGTLKYVRKMDWDMEPTAFSETVLLEPGNAVDLECLHNNGFANPDPSDISGDVCVNTQTFYPVNDQGAYFRFNFVSSITNATPLEVGASKSFKTYYGAAPSRAQAEAILAAVDVEAYSFGNSVDAVRSGVTAFFGFAGVGGTSVISDVYTVECPSATPCQSVTVESETNSVTLKFDDEGPFTECN